MGTRHRLEGLLLNSNRGLVLKMDDGGVWALDTGRHAARRLRSSRDSPLNKLLILLQPPPPPPPGKSVKGGFGG